MQTAHFSWRTCRSSSHKGVVTWRVLYGSMRYGAKQSGLFFFRGSRHPLRRVYSKASLTLPGVGTVVLRSYLRPAHSLAVYSLLDSAANMVLASDIDLLHPPKDVEQSKHKLKRLVQSPNSYFMDVKCQGCFNITTVFSHSQTVVTCTNCSTILCTPTGGKARLTEGCSFRRKGD